MAHNVLLLARLDALATLGRPLLVGASRKSFIGQLSGDLRGARPPGERLAGSLAAAAWACRGGARVVRVRGTGAPTGGAVAGVDRARPALSEAGLGRRLR